MTLYPQHLCGVGTIFDIGHPGKWDRGTKSLGNWGLVQ